MSDYSAYISRVLNLEQDLRESLDFIGWADVVRSDSRLFIKPNFTYPYYKEGVTTSPDVLRVLCGILKDRCNQVIIGESDGGNHSHRADDAFKGHGMDKICQHIGMEQVNLSTLPSRYIEDMIQGKAVKVQVPNPLLLTSYRKQSVVLLSNPGILRAYGLQFSASRRMLLSMRVVKFLSRGDTTTVPHEQ